MLNSQDQAKEKLRQEIAEQMKAFTGEIEIVPPVEVPEARPSHYTGFLEQMKVYKGRA